MAAAFQIVDKPLWLSLGDACRLPDVSQATLRQRADGGHLRVHRTPGGHRRFLRDDLVAFAEGSSSPADADGPQALGGSVLMRIRRRLQQETVASQPWYRSVEEEGRVRMRLFGRSLPARPATQGRDGRSGRYAQRNRREALIFSGG